MSNCQKLQKFLKNNPEKTNIQWPERVDYDKQQLEIGPPISENIPGNNPVQGRDPIKIRDDANKDQKDKKEQKLTMQEERDIMNETPRPPWIAPEGTKFDTLLGGKRRKTRRKKKKSYLKKSRRRKSHKKFRRKKR